VGNKQGNSKYRQKSWKINTDRNKATEKYYIPSVMLQKYHDYLVMVGRVSTRHLVTITSREARVDGKEIGFTSSQFIWGGESKGHCMNNVVIVNNRGRGGASPASYNVVNNRGGGGATPAKHMVVA